jgi:predicted nucleic acid-binding protein
LIYAFGKDDPRQETARRLLSDGGVIGVQTVNELVAVARGKLHMSWKEVSEALTAIRVLCAPPTPLTIATHDAAVQIAERYGYHIFDSLVIAAALEAGCSVLYSEDLQDGQVIQGLTIQNPFLPR